MFCNVNTRDFICLKKKEKKKRYVYILHYYLIYQFQNEMMNKIFDLSTFFFSNHFKNYFTNSVISNRHSE